MEKGREEWSERAKGRRTRVHTGVGGVVGIVAKVAERDFVRRRGVQALVGIAVLEKSF